MKTNATDVLQLFIERHGYRPDPDDHADMGRWAALKDELDPGWRERAALEAVDRACWQVISDMVAEGRAKVVRVEGDGEPIFDATDGGA